MEYSNMIINPTEGSTSFESAAHYCKARPDATIGLTSGSFDLFHDFHLRYLMQCKRQCDILVVGVDSNAHVQERKGLSRPIMSEFQRVMLVNALKYVDFSYIQHSLEDFTRVAETLGTNVVFRNQEFLGREQEVAVGTSGAKVIIIPDIAELDSTTNLIKRIRGEASL
ncbi:MAG: adenylyltransferase/cytidyltransferase family protein [Patescibacteria group bacterium]